MHERLRDALLERWGRLVTTKPRLTVAICILLAGIGAALSVTGLQFKPERSDLISTELDWNRRYAEYKEQFDRWDDVLVCVEREIDDPELDGLIINLAETLLDNPSISAADAGFDIRKTPRLFQLADYDNFNNGLNEIKKLRAVAEADDVTGALGSILQQESIISNRNVSLDLLRNVLSPYLEAAKGKTANFKLPGFDDDSFNLMRTESGKIRLISVQFTKSDKSASGFGQQIASLRSQIDTFFQAREITDVKWGVTGLPAIEADETTQSITDSTRASVLALVLITLLMLVVFRGFSVPLLATASLIIGLGWSFGWVVLSVGHLQLLSVIFSVVLLGLGVDFALHIVARLELIAHDHDELSNLIPRVFRGIGPGMVTGAITTAAAFIAISFTDFRGAAEMGIISGGGILLCLIAVLSSFPALLALTGRWKEIIRHRHGGEEAHFMADHLHWVSDHPRIIVIFAVITISVLVYLSLQVRYDPNVLNLHPPGIESVEWEERLISEDSHSVWAALLLVQPDDAEGVVKKLMTLPEVSEVGGMGILYTSNREERIVAINAVMTSPSETLNFGPGAMSMAILLNQIRDRLSDEIDPDKPNAELQLIAEEINFALKTQAALSKSNAEQAWKTLNDSFQVKKSTYQEFVKSALSTEQLSAQDLPEPLRKTWIGNDGSWLIRINPSVTDLPVLHPDRLEAFVTNVRDVEPQILGPPIQIYESSILIKSAYQHAAVYALIAILILLMFDFRSIMDSLCAILPVVLGFVGTFGFMTIFDVPLNLANMIVMPIILGIGVDAGVHVVHRWRAEPNGRPAGLSGGTGRGITLTMITTMLGFGCMMIAEHRGIRSLGFVMVVGLITTLIACYTVLPAFLHLRQTDKPSV